MISYASKAMISSTLRGFIRSKSSHSENVLLADALNLLSPATEAKNASEFRPSLYNNLTKGSAVEQFRNEEIIKYDIPITNNTEKYLNNLLSGINSSSLLDISNSELLRMTNKDLSSYIKGIDQHSRLKEILELFYFQDRLNIKILTEIVLNKSLKDLNSLPINVFDLKSNSNIAWPDAHYIQFRIIMLKKLYDLKQPLLLIKNLRENFDKFYYPMIKAQKLSPFYERIVWKFYFEYIKQFDEIHYIDILSNVRSAFLIWEGSSKRNYDIAKFTLEHKQLSTMQKLFLKICVNKNVQQFIDKEFFHTRHSKLLSELKKISIKFKVYSVTDNIQGEREKLNCYLLINSLERFIKCRLSECNDERNELTLILQEMQNFKLLNLMNLHETTKQSNWFEGANILTE